MKASTLRTWYAIHRWTSLICTLNLLVLCLTGLLLIFHDDIDDWLGQGHPEASVAQAGAKPKPSVQSLIDVAQAMHAGQVAKSIFFGDENFVNVRVGPPGEPKLAVGKSVQFNGATGERNNTIPGETFSGFILKLHVNLFLGLPGQLFMGVMGLIFVLSLVSGLILYAPFMRKLAFGLLRFGKSTRVVNADFHNLFGIVVMVWALVVGLTGAFLSFSPLILGVWQKTELQNLIETLPGPKPARLIAVDSAIGAAQAAVPGKDIAYVFYPGTEYSTGRHYGVVLRGHTELEKRVFTIAMVDADNGAVSAVRGMPWYLQVLLLSGPFHFGNYAGRPLQILWALLTIMTAGATVTGFVVWLKRHRRSKVAGGAAEPDVAPELTLSGEKA